MSCSGAHPEGVAVTLRRSYRHFVSDPKTFDTVPEQLSLTREADGTHVYGTYPVQGELSFHRFDRELPKGSETITTGL
jgi:hypothetical protein